MALAAVAVVDAVSFVNWGPVFCATTLLAFLETAPTGRPGGFATVASHPGVRGAAVVVEGLVDVRLGCLGPRRSDQCCGCCGPDLLQVRVLQANHVTLDPLHLCLGHGNQNGPKVISARGALACLSACLPICPSARLPVCPSVYLPVCLSICLCLLDYLPACLLACLPACLLACLPFDVPRHGGEPKLSKKALEHSGLGARLPKVLLRTSELQKTDLKSNRKLYSQDLRNACHSLHTCKTRQS